MDMEPTIRTVQETQYGLYVWQMPNGQIVGDDEDRFLSIAAKEGDLRKIIELQKVVRHYGITEGRPMFLPGRRKVSDDEYAEQLARLNMGLTPDPYDVGALKDELNDR